MKQVEIYTDGACSGNPGPGGIGVVMLHGVHRRELSWGYAHTTNNRMELMAAIAALETLKYACAVRLYSDSRYLVESMQNGWVLRWKAAGWKKKKNADLWTRLLEAVHSHEVAFEWVKGHSSNPLNNRCDELATSAIHADLQPDAGYEREQERQGAQLSLL